MKKNKINIVFIVLIIVAVLGLVAYYLFDVFYNNTPYKDNLFRTLAVVSMLIATAIRLSKTGSRKRNSLDLYEKIFENEIGFAFQNKPILKKKLLCAIRLYHEENYRKALKYLGELLKECEFNRDSAVVLFFIALC